MRFLQFHIFDDASGDGVTKDFPFLPCDGQVGFSVDAAANNARNFVLRVPGLIHVLLSPKTRTEIHCDADTLREVILLPECQAYAKANPKECTFENGLICSGKSGPFRGVPIRVLREPLPAVPYPAMPAVPLLMGGATGAARRAVQMALDPELAKLPGAGAALLALPPGAPYTSESPPDQA